MSKCERNPLPSGVGRFKYMLIAILLCAFPVFGQNTNSRELLKQPDIQKAINTIWQQTSNGTTGVEAAFTVNGSPDNYTIEMTHSDGQIGQNHIKVYSNTFAIFHVHPNFGGPKPSTPADHYGTEGKGDTWIGDKHQCDMYVVSLHAIWVYYWRTKQMVLLVEQWQDTLK
jgi:hypothetical protein